jgi:hypothetical protein
MHHSFTFYLLPFTFCLFRFTLDAIQESEQRLSFGVAQRIERCHRTRSLSFRGVVFTDPQFIN